MHEKLPNFIAKTDHASILPPTPCPTTPDSSYKNGISDEITWFKTANTPAAWTRYHFQRSQHTRKPDISAIFPSIDVLVRTLDAQHHCMEIVEKTAQLLMKVISRYVSYRSSFNGDCSIDLTLRNILACFDYFI